MDPISTSQIKLLRVITNKTSDDNLNAKDLKYLIDNGLVVEQAGRVDYAQQMRQPWKMVKPPSTYRLTHMGQQVLRNAWR
jgi:hypothetical protein